ncbi:winged helix-turn-helix domain-containing protein [Prevotella sp. oral taxon 475]|uniref:winged helix-turn-helix domain-containing protein n=1 Tax=Prevotella sp. oral taxon 475 TaxID=712471 RepID=UPI001BA8EBBF|nr:winged helix-turn-helix domain-containing protein [Prevotella sp. oral taxon 475]QUB46874.1 winged helix-turn-helix domain-containing protein [Prevotella sp. oral taxon 475]
MAEKKATKTSGATAAVATEKKAVAVKKPAAKKTSKPTWGIDAESVGFRAGDVYQALSSAGKALTVAQIAKASEKSEEEVLLGIGWLFKEGKIKGEGQLVTLA